MKKILIISLAIFSLAAGTSGATYLITHKANHKSKTITKPHVYPYAYLSNKCNSGLQNYKLMETSIDRDIASTNSLAQQKLASLKANEDSLGADYITGNNSDLGQENTALSSGDSYLAGVIQKVIVNKANSYQQSLASLKTQETSVQLNAQTELDKLTASKKVVADRESRLLSCVEAVNMKRNLTVREVSDTESYIATSTTRP
jgi:hypothetical protein